MARAANHASPHPPTQPHIETIQSMVERGITLAVDDHFRLPQLNGTPRPRRRLTSTCYDTSRYDLTRAGITLRSRAERGRQAWHLTLPLNNDRQELEIVDHHSTPPAQFRELLFLHTGQRRLVPVATLRTRRRTVRLHAGNVTIADITLDQIAVVKHRAVLAHVRELTITRIDGTDTELRDIERQLRRAGAGDHDGRSALCRVLSLPAPGTEGQPGPDAPVAAHVTWALARHARWLLAHDPGARLGREPESLHQLRVATRQLRAILRAAAPPLAPKWADSLRHELAWLSQVLGPARDLDVHLADVRRDAAQLETRDRQPLKHFVAHLEALRATAQEGLRNELRRTRYLHLIKRLQAAAQDPAIVESTITLRELAGRTFKTLRKAIRRAGVSPGNTRVHEIRVKTKRARYAAELAEPAVGKAARRFITVARALQDLLGMHQDAIQAEARIRAFVASSTNVRAAFVAGRMVERQRERQTQARQQMGKQLRRLVKRGKQAWG